jgi:hypothetical protein
MAVAVARHGTLMRQTLEYRRNLAAARAQLDDAAWQVAWQEGWAMNLDEAVEYAMKKARVPLTN